MLILFGLSLVVVAGLIAIRLSWLALGFCLCLVGSIPLITALLMLPISRVTIHSGIEEYTAVRETLARARQRGETLENAAIQLEVIKANQWLASTVYWNDTVFDLWTPDAVEELEPIK